MAVVLTARSSHARAAGYDGGMTDDNSQPKERPASQQFVSLLFIWLGGYGFAGGIPCLLVMPFREGLSAVGVALLLLIIIASGSMLAVGLRLASPRGS